MVFNNRYRESIDNYCGETFYQKDFQVARPSIEQAKRRLSISKDWILNFDDDTEADDETKTILKDARERFLSSTKSIYLYADCLLQFR